MTSAGTAPRNPAIAAAAVMPRTGDRVFAGRPDQVREARRFLGALLAGSPVTGDAVLCVSELASNAVLHSNSSRAGGTFTVHFAVFDGHCVYIQVQDDGGLWQEPAHDDGRAHGLDIVCALASDYGRDGDALAGWVPGPGSTGQPAIRGHRMRPETASNEVASSQLLVTTRRRRFPFGG